MTLEELIEMALRKKQNGSIALRSSPDELLRLLETDPRNAVDRGRRKAILRRLAGPDAQLAGQLLGAVDPQPDDHVLPPHPMVLDAGSLPERRPFGPGDVELLREIGAKPPAQVTAEEARLVAELEATAETSGDRHLVARIAGPLRRHTDIAREKEQLHATLAAASTTVRWEDLARTALPALTDRLVEDAIVELVENLGAGTPRATLDQVAENTAAAVRETARAALRTAWETTSAARPQRRAEAEQRLRDLALGGDPASPSPSPASFGDAGRRRAQRERAARPVASDLPGLGQGSVPA